MFVFILICLVGYKNWIIESYYSYVVTWFNEVKLLILLAYSLYYDKATIPTCLLGLIFNLIIPIDLLGLL